MPRVENRACNAFMAAAAIAKTDLPTINYGGKIFFQAFFYKKDCLDFRPFFTGIKM